MKKIFLLYLFVLLAVIKLPAQSKDSVIRKVLQAISNFQSSESKRDSALNHPLGSFTEADFIRKHSFNDSVYTVLNNTDKASLTGEDQINIELLKYQVGENVSNFRYKAYLNPILSDEGFHTRLAAMGSQIFSTTKEFENYIKSLKDIPRYVNEHLDLMRKGLQAGICQPAVILNGYENTYLPARFTGMGKSVWCKLAGRWFFLQPLSIARKRKRTLYQK